MALPDSRFPVIPGLLHQHTPKQYRRAVSQRTLSRVSSASTLDNSVQINSGIVAVTKGNGGFVWVDAHIGGSVLGQFVIDNLPVSHQLPLPQPPPSGRQPATATKPGCPVVVQTGQTLSSIAQRAGISRKSWISIRNNEPQLHCSPGDRLYLCRSGHGTAHDIPPAHDHSTGSQCAQ